MRIAKVIGTVTLNRSLPSLRRSLAARRAPVAERSGSAAVSRRRIPWSSGTSWVPDWTAGSLSAKDPRRRGRSTRKSSRSMPTTPPFSTNSTYAWKGPISTFRVLIANPPNPQPGLRTMINAHRIKQDICEIGRRIYNRGFAAANDGNITVRISDNEVLCTPTLHCKGFLTPEDISTLDMQGNQIAGRKKRSSEALLHLEIYKARAEIKSVVHCHPPHATAFAIAREAIPQCVLPEVEVFLGDVPITKYETPGGRTLPKPSCLSYRRRTSSSWRTTAPSASARRSKKPIGGPKSSIPTVAC